MSEKPKENIQDVIGDITKKPETEAGINFEVSSSPELARLAKYSSAIKNAIDHDQPVVSGQLQEMQEAIGKVTINLGGEEISIEELEKIPDFERDMEIWEEMKRADLSNVGELTHITPEIAERLSHYPGTLPLNKLVSISDRSAEIISHHKGDLYLRSLTSLSDKAAEHLSHYEGEWLVFERLTSFSDQAAEYLSHYQGNLELSGPSSLSDQVAEYLSHHKGRLFLNSLTSLSDKAVESLSHHQGYLSLNGLISLSDQAAEHLSHFEYWLTINGLKFLSDKAAENLAKYKGDAPVLKQINKLRKV